MTRREVDRINAMSQEQTEDWLRRSSITYLECCISLMLTHMSTDEVVAVLREEASQLEELG